MGVWVPGRWVIWVMGMSMADAYGEEKKRKVQTDCLQSGLQTKWIRAVKC